MAEEAQDAAPEEVEEAAVELTEEEKLGLWNCLKLLEADATRSTSRLLRAELSHPKKAIVMKDMKVTQNLFFLMSELVADQYSMGVNLR